MVVTGFWIESATVLIISLCALSAVVVWILCLCWEYKKKLKHQYYVIDRGNLKKVSSLKIMNNLAPEDSSPQTRKEVFNYFPKTNNYIKNVLFANQKKKFCSRSDLLHPQDLGIELNQTILCLEDKINCKKSANNQEQEEDLKSCLSDESRSSFYSMYPTESVGNIRSVHSFTSLDICTIE